MSIITEAMRKAGLQRQSAAAAPQAPEQRLRGRKRSGPSTEQVKEVLRFQPASIDREVMIRTKVLTHLDDRAARRSYKILRTRVLQRLEQQQWHSLAVTSSAASAGKTLTAVNLSLALAQDPNTWVFLVDLDLQRPNVAASLAMSHGPGMSEYLQGQAAFEDVIYDPGIERLSIVPAGAIVQQSSELLSSSRMGQFMGELEALTPKRIIVYDVPPLLVSDDVLIIAPQIDSLLLVATEGVTVRSTLEQAREVLAEMNVLGVVLNRSSERDESPYY